MPQEFKRGLAPQHSWGFWGTLCLRRLGNSANPAHVWEQAMQGRTGLDTFQYELDKIISLVNLSD